MTAKARKKLTLTACCATHGVQDGLTATIYVLLPVLAQTFGLSYAQIGMIRAAHGGTMWVLELVSGVLSERFGERNLLAFGLLCAGAGYLSVSAAEGYHGVLIGLAVAGCGAAFQHALCSSLVSREFGGPGRRSALGAYNASGDGGKLAFTGLATLLAGAGVAWQQTASGYGAFAVAAGAGLLLVLRAARAGDRAPPSGREGGLRGTDWGIRRPFEFVALSVIVFLDIAVQDGFLVLVAFLMLHKGLPAGMAGLAVVLLLAGGMVGKFGCSLLAARIGVVRALALVEALSALGILAVLAAPAELALCLLPVVGVVLQGSSTITYGTVGDLVDEGRHSRGFALVYTIVSGASIVGPISFGLVSDGAGIGAAMAAMAVVVALPAPLGLLLRGALPRAEPGSARANRVRRARWARWRLSRPARRRHP